MHPPAPPQSPAGILVVKNHDEIRRLMFVVLHRSGYQTSEAADGKEALAAMSRAK